MATRYLALLRGINVGGNALIKMAALKQALSVADFTDVATYIQSGNVMFSSSSTDKLQLAKKMQKIIKTTFDLDVDIIIFSSKEWREVVSAAPHWWGKSDGWKHNLLITTKPHNIEDVIKAMGELKPGIEKVEPGKGAVYQSLSFKDFGKTTSGKIASIPIYKQMTIRNYNTATKLAQLLS